MAVQSQRPCRWSCRAGEEILANPLTHANANVNDLHEAITSCNTTRSSAGDSRPWQSYTLRPLSSRELGLEEKSLSLTSSRAARFLGGKVANRAQQTPPEGRDEPIQATFVLQSAICRCTVVSQKLPVVPQERASIRSICQRGSMGPRIVHHFKGNCGEGLQTQRCVCVSCTMLPGKSFGLQSQGIWLTKRVHCCKVYSWPRAEP